MPDIDMNFVGVSEQSLGAPSLKPGVSPFEEEAPGFFGVIGNNFMDSNIPSNVVGLIRRKAQLAGMEDDPDFDVEAELDRIGAQGRNREILSEAKSRNQMSLLSLQIQKENRRKQRMAGDSSLANLVGGLVGQGLGIVVDPLVLLPLAGHATKVGQIGRAAVGLRALRVGVGVTPTAAEVAGLSSSRLATRVMAGSILAAREEAAREVILHGTQIDRTVSESALNVVAGAALGGVVLPIAGRALLGAGRKAKTFIDDSTTRVENQILKQEAAKAVGEADGGALPATVSSEDSIIAYDGFASRAYETISRAIGDTAARTLMFGRRIGRGESAELAGASTPPPAKNAVEAVGRLFQGEAVGTSTAKAALVVGRSKQVLLKVMYRAGIDSASAQGRIDSMRRVFNGTGSVDDMRDALDVLALATKLGKKTRSKIEAAGDDAIEAIFKAEKASDVINLLGGKLDDGAGGKLFTSMKSLTSQDGVPSVKVRVVKNTPEAVAEVLQSVRNVIDSMGPEAAEDEIARVIAVAAGVIDGDAAANASTIAKSLGLGESPALLKSAQEQATSWQSNLATRDSSALQSSLEANLVFLDQLDDLSAQVTRISDEVRDTIAVDGSDLSEEAMRKLELLEDMDFRLKELNEQAKSVAKGSMEEKRLQVGIEMLREEMNSLTMANSLGWNWLLKMFGVNPGLDLYMSASAVVRQIGNALIAPANLTKGEVAGNGFVYAVQTAKRVWRSMIGSNVDHLNRLHRASGLSREVFDQAVRDGVIEFRRAGFSAIDNAQVKEAVLLVRNTMGMLENQLIKTGVVEGSLDEDYLTQMYNVDKILDNVTEFRGHLISLLKKADADGKLRIDKEAGETIEDVAQALTDTITGYGVRSGKSSGGTSRLKHRKMIDLGITPEDMKDWTTSDINMIMTEYVERMSGLIEVQRAMGSTKLEDIQAAAEQEYKTLIDKAKGTRREKVLRRERDRVLGTANKKGMIELALDEAMGGASTGSYSGATSPLKVILDSALNIMVASKVPGFALSSIVDTGNIVARLGAEHTLPHMHNMFGTVVEIIKKGENRDVLLNEWMNIADASRYSAEHFARHKYNVATASGSKLVEWTRRLSDWSMEVGGMMYTTSAMKTMGAMLYSNKMLAMADTVASGKSLSKNDRILLGRSGLLEEDLKQLAKSPTQKYGTITLPDLGEMDPSLAAKFDLSVKKNVQDFVPEASRMDKPAFLSEEGFRIMGALRSFTLSSAAKVTGRGLQEAVMNPAGSRAYFGFLLSSGLGLLDFTIRSGIKDMARGKDPSERLSQLDAGHLASLAVDRGGYLAAPMDAANIFEAVTGFNPLGPIDRKVGQAFSADFSDQSNRRDSIIEALHGPGGSTVDQTLRGIFGTPFNVATGQGLSERDVISTVNTLPLASTLGAGELMARVLREQGVIEEE